MKIEKGNRVKVEFTSESRTQFSGEHVKGVGIVDLSEDGYVFGKFVGGKPFMCLETDCELLKGMATHYIEQLGVAKCREILKGAPEGATGFNNTDDKEYDTYVITKPEWNELNKHSYWHIDGMTGMGRWAYMANIFAGYNMLVDLIPLSSIRAELSAYDTDLCTDIANHISPNTVVVG